MRSQHSNMAAVLLVATTLLAAGQAHALPITGGSGPGGVGTQDGSSNLFLWLRADKGISEDDTPGFVSDWADLSGNSRDGSQTSTTNQPAIVSSLPGLNNRPVVRTDDPSEHYINLNITGTSASDFTFFYAIAPGSNSSNSYLLDRPGDNTTTRFITGYNGSGSSPGQPGYFHNGGWVRSSDAADTSTQQLTFVLNSSASNASRIYRDGTTLTLIETANYAQRSLNSAGIPGSATSTFSGDYAEVAVFDTALNSTRRVIVQNYMASLYGLTTAQDFYAGDMGGNGNYDLDVFGIGNDGTTSFTSSGSEGLGIQATGGTLDSGEFVLAGHKTTTNSLTPADVSTERWERVWYIDTNGASIDVTLGFGWSDSGLTEPFDADFNALYYSPTDPFSFSRLATASIISGDQVFFDLLAADFQTGYYTLGIQAVPEPSSLLLLGLGLIGFVRWRRALRRRANVLALAVLVLSVSVVTSTGSAAPIQPDNPTFSWLFDDGTGTTATAQSGPHDGTLTGGASFNSIDTPFAYPGNYAIELDGSSGFVEVADAVDLRPGSSAWTISAWMRTADTDLQGTIISKREPLSPFDQMALYVGDTSTSLNPGRKVQALLISTGSNRWWYYTTNDVLDGDWHHVALVRPTTGDARVYIDGSLAAITLIQDNNSEPQDVDNTEPWRFGNNNASIYFDGLIDEVAMWNTDLSGDNIEWLALHSLSSLVPEPSTFLLLGLGVFGLMQQRSRQRRRRV